MPRKKASIPPPPEPIRLEPPADAVEPPVPGQNVSWSLFLLGLFGWGLVSIFFLGLQNFHPVLNNTSGFNLRNWNTLVPFFWIGLALLAWAFKSMPDSMASGDIGRTPARFCLLLILLLAAFMRLYGTSAPPGHYWADFQLAVVDGSQISDYNKLFVFAKYQRGEPLYAYVIAFFLRFFPGMDGIVVQRLALTLFDLAAVWVLYLAGKELGGRRVGLLAASFAAVSKPMLMLVLSYMRYGTTQVAVALVLLFSLRLFKKPDWKHFLQWGAALSLGYYTYTAFQTFGLVVLFVVFLWVLLRETRKGFRFWEWFFGWGMMAFLALLFLFSHRTALKEAPLLRNLVYGLADGNFIFLFGVALAWAFLQMVQTAWQKKSGKSMVYFALGLFMALALVLPAFRAGIGGYLGVPFLDETRGFSPGKTLDYFQGRLYMTFMTLFNFGRDRGDINLIGDPFFGVTDLIFIFPGLVFVAMRPSWPRLFVLLAAAGGLTPHLFADAGGNRLAACTVPFLLLGALGLNHFWQTATFTSRPAFFRGLTACLWLGLLAFGGVTVFQKAHLHFNAMKSGQVHICEQIRKDCPTNRVYGNYAEETGPVGIMNERYLSYEFRTDDNPIYLEPSEEQPNVVVLLRDNKLPKLDIIETLKAQFPRAEWTQIRMNPDYPRDLPVYLLRMFIPKDQLSEDPSKIFHIVQVPVSRWVRRLYPSGYRMGYGLVFCEDRVVDLTDPFPAVFRKFDPIPTMRCIGNFNAPEGGKYRFAVETDNMTDLWIDGKRVIRHRPDKKARREARVRLSQGSHSIHITTYHPRMLKLPDVSVRYPGFNEWKPL